jgi:hypothetical protein
MKNHLVKLLSGFDVTEIFKTKGDSKRWSAKRTIGGTIVLTACAEIVEHEISWMAVVMCLIGIIPISLSFFETD